MRLGRRKHAEEDRLADATRLAQEEGRQAARRRREADRAQRRRAQREALLGRAGRLRARLRGGMAETGRRLGPLGLATQRLLGAIAPYVSRALFAPIRVAAVGLARLLELSEAVIRWLRQHVGGPAFHAGGFLYTNVTPLRTYAALGAAAAIIVAGAQFADYKSVEVNSLFYEGEVGSVAPAPTTEVETAGSAHLYVLLPIAIAALYLIWAAYRGNWRLGRWAGALGLLGVLVSLAVDLPQGLDTGLSGIAFEGSEANLIGGFWAQLFGSAVLAACGFAVAAQVRRATGDEGEPGRRSLRSPWRRRRGEGRVPAPWRTQA